MARKHKIKASTNQKQHQWKPIPIESAQGLSKEDFEGVVGIEELTSYRVIDSKASHPESSKEKAKKKKKKKIHNKSVNLKKRKLSQVNQFVVEIIEDETEEAAKVDSNPPEEVHDVEKQIKDTEEKQIEDTKEKQIEDVEEKQTEDVKEEKAEGVKEWRLEDYIVDGFVDFEDEEFEDFEDFDEEEEIISTKVDLTQWLELSVPRPILKCLSSMGLENPTAIQKATIKEAIENRVNVYGAAPTGSGKTLAFGIPLLSHIIQDKEKEDEDFIPKVRAIILTPTRELAVQIKNHLESINNHSTVNIALIVGGLAIEKQERILQKIKPDILVGTPGRLWEIISSNTVPFLCAESMYTLRYLVIDEADRMIEKSHFAELRELINLWLSTEDKSVWDERQVFIFSATLTMTKEPKNSKNRNTKAKDSENEDLIQLLRLDRNKLRVHDLTEGGKQSTPSSDQLQESIINCMKEEKDLYLFYFVTLNPGKTIVFCNSIDCIRRLTNIANFLQLNPLSVHSSMPQKRRLQAIERFTEKDNTILFATDVAARGLDIANIDHVVHYQVPRTAEIYIHRSGRTARVDAKGLSLILCDPQEEAFFMNDFYKILNKESVDKFTIDSRILNKIRERIQLAQQCDKLEHQLRKEKSNENWFRTTAKACDMVVEDSDEKDSDTDTTSLSKAEHHNNRRKLRACKQKLDALLKQSLVYRDRL